MEKMKGKKSVEVSFVPKIIIDSEFNPIKKTLRGNMGYPR
jgi:hypothetical protein